MTHDVAEAGEAKHGRLADHARSHARRDSSERPGSPPLWEEIQRCICWKLAVESEEKEEEEPR